jgi:hypothetical protein
MEMRCRSPPGEGRAVLPDHGLIPLGKLGDKLITHVNPQHSAVERNMIILDKAPFHAGVKLIIGSAEFVPVLEELLC